MAVPVVALACLVLGVMLRRETKPVEKPSVPPVMTLVTPPLVEPVAPPRTVRRPIAKPARKIETAAKTDGQVVIRIETPDPDVVILLIGDE